ncbi:MAG TPA: DUF484 family protein [Methylophilaceae bacterium]|jgi:hypothetical protein
MELDDDQVAQFLRADPQFFERNLKLLDEITLPDLHGGAAVSLMERQQTAMRDKLRVIESKLAELVKFGETNDAISERVHRLSVALLSAENFNDLADAITSNLHDDFQVPHVALRLWGNPQPDISARPEFSSVEFDLRAWVDGLAIPYCGHKPGLDIDAWFGETNSTLKSFALIALRSERSFGLLALASEDAQRFYPEMGTMFLKRIGELVSAALKRYVA